MIAFVVSRLLQSLAVMLAVAGVWAAAGIDSSRQAVEPAAPSPVTFAGCTLEPTTCDAAPVEDGAHRFVVRLVDARERHVVPRHHGETPLGCIGHLLERVDRGDLEGELHAADTGDLGGENQQVGR